MTTFHIITLFPDAIEPYTRSSILRRAQEAGKIAVTFYDLREYAEGKHKTTDEKPYGGGPGMVLKPQPILKAIEAVGVSDVEVIILSPAGEQFSNVRAKALAEGERDIILIAGHYEGIDARVGTVLADNGYAVSEISIGPYVLTGGELPALVVVDAVARQIEGVLGDERSLEEKRAASSEVYTRPETLEWNGKEYTVPDVLLSGHHKNIEEWRGSKNGEKF